MAVVLCLSSHVARGFVGASAARAALERLGHEVWVLPTVVLSNHPGHARSGGTRIAPETLQQMLDALEANRWLHRVDAVLTGYLPSEAHVRFAFDMVGRVRDARPGPLVVCDPAFGDAPKGVYVEEEAARAVVDWLLPMADIARLNAFELTWATGRSLTNIQEVLDAARMLGPGRVLVTSVRPNEDEIANVLLDPQGAWCTVAPLRAGAPHGTGDFMTAVFLGQLLNGCSPDSALARATAALEAALRASEADDELRLVSRSSAWHEAPPSPVQILETTT